MCNFEICFYVESDGRNSYGIDGIFSLLYTDIEFGNLDKVLKRSEYLIKTLRVKYNATVLKGTSTIGDSVYFYNKEDAERAIEFLDGIVLANAMLNKN